MFKVDIVEKKLLPLEEASFSEMGIKERYDIQEWIEKNPVVLGEDLLIVTKEYAGFDKTNERLDLMAIDIKGNVVVIELKSDNSGAYVDWQAIKYASYCAQLTAEDIIEIYAQYHGVQLEAAGGIIRDFVGETAILNEQQHIILVARKFRPEITSSVMWLLDKGITIRCVEIKPFWDREKETLFVHFNILLPPPDAEQYIMKRAKVEQKQQERRVIVREYSIENLLQKGSDDIKQLYHLLEEKLVKKIPSMRIHATGNYIGFQDKKNFAEVHIKESKILVHIRPIDIQLHDSEKALDVVPDSHGWSCNTRFSIYAEIDIDKAFSWIYQSYLTQA